MKAGALGRHFRLLCAETTDWLCRAPYDGLIWLAWIYVVGATIYAGGGPFAGDLINFDDRVRLVHIFDWLDGAGWYDRVITRVNAPDGFHTIWSRAVDVPTAAIILAFQNVMGRMGAAMLASILLPMVMALLLLFAMAWLAQPLVGEKRAKLVTLFVLFTSALNPEVFTLAGFQAGMVGHHAWYVLLTLLLWGGTARLMLATETRSALIAGVAICGLLIVGIEGLPLIAGTCVLIALLAWWQNRPQLAFDGLCLTALGAAAGFLTLPINQPPQLLLTPSFAEPSIVGPILVLAASLFFAAQFFILKNFGKNRPLGLVLIALCSVALAALLVWLYPALLAGGTAALTPEERALHKAGHLEAVGLWTVARNTTDYVRMIVPPLLAVGFGLFCLNRTQKQAERALLFFQIGIVMLSFAMASVYSRYFHYAALTSCPLLLLFWLEVVEAMPRDRYFALKSFLLYVALGPLWLWIIPAANYNQHFGSSMLLFPAKVQTEPPYCDTRQIADFLDRRYGPDTTLIVPMYDSDHFLLHTHLKLFFLASFPSQNKFIEAKRFYDTGAPEQAHDIARRHGIDLVAVCKTEYIASNPSDLTLQLLHGHMSFGEMLAAGQHPDWLQPVPTTGGTLWLLYAVDKDAR